MRSRFPREWTAREYRSARDFLVNVIPLRNALAAQQVDERIKNLRTHALKGERELFQASLFAHGIGSTVLGTEVFLTPLEDQDFDCIAKWLNEDTWCFAPIQLKEFVPENLNPTASLQSEIDKLKNKYVDSSDLILVFYLNRNFHFDLNALTFHQVNVAQLWLFGAISTDGTRYRLWGNLLDNPASYSFEYPGLK